MCLLTYLPYEGGFVLTSNRDEAINRPRAIPPKKFGAAAYPTDPQGRGTWLATAPGFTVCLLNGAFEKHIPKPPYRQSRGQVVLDFLKIVNTSFFVESYDFSGIEPFTLVVIEANNPRFIREIRWDSAQVHTKNLPVEEAAIWSSATLYSPEIMVERELFLEELLTFSENISPEILWDFHRFGGSESNPLCIQQGPVPTVCISQIIHTKTKHSFLYEDLTTSEKAELSV